MPKSSKLEDRPVPITRDGRLVSYIGRFAPGRFMRWLRRILWGKQYRDWR